MAVSPCLYALFGGWPNLLAIWAWAAFGVALRSTIRREAKLALAFGGLFAALLAGIVLLGPRLDTYYILAALLASTLWTDLKLSNRVFAPLARRFRRGK